MCCFVLINFYADYIIYAKENETIMAKVFHIIAAILALGAFAFGIINFYLFMTITYETMEEYR